MLVLGGGPAFPTFSEIYLTAVKALPHEIAAERRPVEAGSR
jgi:hypothetical protein